MDRHENFPTHTALVRLRSIRDRPSLSLVESGRLALLTILAARAVTRSCSNASRLLPLRTSRLVDCSAVRSPAERCAGMARLVHPDRRHLHRPGIPLDLELDRIPRPIQLASATPWPGIPTHNFLTDNRQLRVSAEICPPAQYGPRTVDPPTACQQWTSFSHPKIILSDFHRRTSHR